MKIAILLETSYSGGGSFTHSINASININKFLNKNNRVVIYTNIKKNFEIIKDLNLPAVLFSFSFLDKILLKLSFFKFFRVLFHILNINTSLENKLLNDKIDLIYFPVLSNTVFSLKKISFISTFLDLEHFRHSIFPEINKKEFYQRERLYFYALKKSLLITVSHKIIKKRMCNHYNINYDKVVVIPYTAGSLFKSKKNLKKIRKKFINLKNYFFYPAQIWAHKNHISILRAAKKLKKYQNNISFVFSGRDRGYKHELEKYIFKNNIKNVHFTGFLDNSEMDYIYKNCKGVIFTSLFGPDAIPPLETWSYKKPLIYNNRNEDDVSKKTAILVDVKNPDAISKAIIKIYNRRYNKNYVLNGLKKLKNVEKDSQRGYLALNKKLKLLFEN